MGRLNTGTLLLTQRFLKDVRGFKKDNKGIFECPSEYKGSVFAQIEDLLRRGVTYHELNETMTKNIGKPLYQVIDMFDNQEKEMLQNQHYVYPKHSLELLQFGKFYYHPQLQESSSAPRTYIDYETMELVLAEGEPFYLEMKDSFTLDNLLDYYLKETFRTDSGLNSEIKRRTLSTELRKIYNQFGLDMTLYLIDAMVSDFLERGQMIPTFATAIVEHIDVAEEMMRNRKDVLSEGGISHVQPRHNTYH